MFFQGLCCAAVSQQTEREEREKQHNSSLDCHKGQWIDLMTSQYRREAEADSTPIGLSLCIGFEVYSLQSTQKRRKKKTRGEMRKKMRSTKIIVEGNACREMLDSRLNVSTWSSDWFLVGDREEKSMDVFPEDIEKQNPRKVIFIQDPRWERRRRASTDHTSLVKPWPLGKVWAEDFQERFSSHPTKENIDNDWLSESKERRWAALSTLIGKSGRLFPFILFW